MYLCVFCAPFVTYIANEQKNVFSKRQPEQAAFLIGWFYGRDGNSDMKIATAAVPTAVVRIVVTAIGGYASFIS